MDGGEWVRKGRGKGENGEAWGTTVMQIEVVVVVVVGSELRDQSPTL